MSQIDLLRAVEQDGTVLNAAAAAMYGIREPKGSKRIPFDAISTGKQARNRELALELLRAVLRRYPDPTKIDNPTELRAYMGEQMYHLLAPKKSEQFPFDSRTPYARSYYQGQAETFMRNFLLPLAREESRRVDSPTFEDTKPKATLPPSSSVTPDRLGQGFPGRPLPSSKSAYSLTSGKRPATAPTYASQVGERPPAESDNQAVTSSNYEISAGTTKASLETNATSPETSGALAFIGCLLLVVIVLLIILVIRTF